jgi:hypothetical protein
MTLIAKSFRTRPVIPHVGAEWLAVGDVDRRRELRARARHFCSCTGSPQGRASVILEYSRDDLLEGFYTHGGDDLIDFVQITDSGTDSLVKLDRDGTEAPTT